MADEKKWWKDLKLTSVQRQAFDEHPELLADYLEDQAGEMTRYAAELRNAHASAVAEILHQAPGTMRRVTRGAAAALHASQAGAPQNLEQALQAEGFTEGDSLLERREAYLEHYDRTRESRTLAEQRGSLSGAIGTGDEAAAMAADLSDSQKIHDAVVGGGDRTVPSREMAQQQVQKAAAERLREEQVQTGATGDAQTRDRVAAERGAEDTPAQTLAVPGDEKPDWETSQMSVEPGAHVTDAPEGVTTEGLPAGSTGAEAGAGGPAPGEADVPAATGDEPTADQTTDEETGVVDRRPYPDRTVAELQDLARDRGLAVSGTKDELVARLRGGGA